ncbi:MAG: hypothetical protein OEP52_02445 [Acidimicrobiia bacterium]|nr:hypothetical protein [Acidimicrobiia bacterium]
MPSPRILIAAFAFGLIAAACSSTEPAAVPEAISSPHVPSSGTVTLDVSEVTADPGLVMLSVIGKQVPNQPMGAVCGLVDADPFTFEGVFAPIIGDDPCTLGTEPVEFAPGPYEVVVAVLPGGARTPDRCVRTEVTVDGDVTLRVTELGPPIDCGF